VGLPQFAIKNHAVSHSFLLPSGMGRRIRRKKAKLVGWDENSLTEWQREKKTTINNTDKSIYNMQCSHHLMFSLLLSSKKPLLQPAPHLNTEHDIIWYRISHLIGCLGQLSQLLVKIDSISAEPRTQSHHCHLSHMKFPTELSKQKNLKLVDTIPVYPGEGLVCYQILIFVQSISAAFSSSVASVLTQGDTAGLSVPSAQTSCQAWKHMRLTSVFVFSHINRSSSLQ